MYDDLAKGIDSQGASIRAIRSDAGCRLLRYQINPQTGLYGWVRVSSAKTTKAIMQKFYRTAASLVYDNTQA